MAQYKTDLQDIYFNLFDVLKVHENKNDLGRDEIRSIVDELDKFAANEIYPNRQKADHDGIKLSEDGVKVPQYYKETMTKMIENGWFALGFPEEFGGMPVPESIHTLALSLICAADVSFSMYPGLTGSAIKCILEVGTDEQKQKFAAPMIAGQYGGTMCLTEAGAGSDVGALTSTAKDLGDGKYNIQGTKIFISSGDNDLYGNIVHLVLARTDDGDAGTKGISLFIVPKNKINNDGTNGENNDVKCTKIEEKMGLHGQATCELTFGANGNCEGYLIGEKFEGMANMFIMMNEARLLCGVQGESQANLCYKLTEQYLKERSQFGVEIVKHPDVKRMALKMRAMVRGLRSLILYTSNLFDLEDEKKGTTINEIGLLTPICKAYCSDEGFNSTVDAIQMHGGYGYCSEYGIEQFARDLKIASIYEGTNGIQAIDFIGRKILRDQAKTLTVLTQKIAVDLKKMTDEKFSTERELIKTSIINGEKILTKFSTLAGAKKMDLIFQDATDFLTYCGHLVVAWRLGVSALEAESQLASKEGDAQFLESKIIDFKIFCQHYLSKNNGISHSILGFEQNISAVEL